MSIPDFIWAQDKDNIHITILQTNCCDEIIEIKDNSIEIKFNSVINYACNLDLFGEIEVENSNWENNRNLKFTLKRKDKEYWKTLSNNYKNKIKTDWSRWVDEDESEDDEMEGTPGMDLAQEMMKNMAGGGNMPDMQEMMKSMGDMQEMMKNMDGDNVPDMAEMMKNMGGMPGMEDTETNDVDDNSSNNLDENDLEDEKVNLSEKIDS